jgi:hypothetical protein
MLIGFLFWNKDFKAAVIELAVLSFMRHAPTKPRKYVYNV